MTKHQNVTDFMFSSLLRRVIDTWSRNLCGYGIRRHLVSLAIACLVIPAEVSLATFNPPSNRSETSDQEVSDKSLMEELRREIEALPKGAREPEGIAILERSLPRFTSATTRHRVLVSIGELSAKLDRYDQAIDAFRRGLALAADPLLTSACRSRLAELLSAMGRTDEAADVLAAVPEPDADRVGISDLPADRTDDVFEAERKRIELVIDQGKDEEGFERILRFARVYPRHHREPLVMFERITAPMYLAGDYAKAIRWRRRASEALPHASDDPMFMSNATVELQAAAQRDEAMKERASEAMIAFVKRFPDHNSAASFLKALGLSSEMAGDLNAAKGFYERILASKLAANDPQRRSATIDLARVTGEPIAPTAIDASPSGKSLDSARRRWLIVSNASLVAAITAWLLYRRRNRV